MYHCTYAVRISCKFNISVYSFLHFKILHSTRMEMFCPSVEDSLNLNLPEMSYLHHLVSQLPDECYLQSISEDQTDLHHIMTLPLLDKIRTVMKQGEKKTTENCA